MAEVSETAELGLDMLREALQGGRSIEIRAFGFSMWPRIRHGAMVHVEPCAIEGIQLGDVVLFERPGRFVLHRVIRLSSRRLLVKGDTCLDVDGWIPHERVLGRMKSRPGDRLLGRLGPHLARPLGAASVVARRLGRIVSKF